MWSRALRGDGAALGGVFDLHADRVFRHVFAVLRDAHDAEDATAAAFLELWRRRAAVRVIEGSVLPWLLVTAANCARNLDRSRRRYRPCSVRCPAASTPSPPRRLRSPAFP